MIALAVPFVLAGFLVARQAFMPPEWRAGLDRYVAHKAASLGEAITVQRVERARKPWKFSQDMSSSVFGDGLYFRPDYTLRPSGTSPAGARGAGGGVLGRVYGPAPGPVHRRLDTPRVGERPACCSPGGEPGGARMRPGVGGGLNR